MDKIDNIVVSDLVEKAMNTKTLEDFSSLQKQIENAIVILHGDLRSIDRQIDQREITKTLDEKLGDGYDKEQYEQWLFKIRRAIQYKKDQIRTLERALGNARDGQIDKKYIFVDKLLESAALAASVLDEIEEAETIDSIRDSLAYRDLDKTVEFLDRSWEGWDE
jgi:hypothetical protein